MTMFKQRRKETSEPHKSASTLAENAAKELFELAQRSAIDGTATEILGRLMGQNSLFNFKLSQAQHSYIRELGERVQWEKERELNRVPAHWVTSCK